MKKKELLALVNQTKKQICSVLDKQDSSITFMVDENLSRPIGHLMKYKKHECGTHIIERFLYGKQIPEELYNVVESSITDDIIGMDSDVLYQCILTCYGEHRPLVLSPDVVWLIINQTLAGHIKRNAEHYRQQIVEHDKYMDLIVKTSRDLLNEKVDWTPLLDGFYSQIDKYTKGNLASTMRCDFSTTSANERIASIATLMEATKSYFHFHIIHMICGIPSITLTGTSQDWLAVKEKATILKKFGLKWWHEWLEPILNEFIEASNGNPHKQFWKSIVLQKKEDDVDLSSGGCLPNRTAIDGWFLALFPFIKGNKQNLSKAIVSSTMESEMVRVGFNYIDFDEEGNMIETPMELWAGIVGVKEDKKTFALTPQIGWFVRKGCQEAESLYRLRSQDEYDGIELSIDTVPDILLNLKKIRKLTLNFTGHVVLPEWMYSLDIEELNISGEITNEEADSVAKRFSRTTLTINDNSYSENKETHE